MPKTLYVVFDEAGGRFKEVARYEASSGKSAIDKHKATLDTLADGDTRRLAATPARSWLVVHEVAYIETRTRSVVVGAGTAVPESQLALAPDPA